MRISTSRFIIIIFLFAVTTIVVIAWYTLNNTPRFNGEFAKVLNIALIKPTFTGAAYHKSFYNFYFIYSSLPSDVLLYLGTRNMSRIKNMII
jgi:hypothetical protein